MYTTTHAQIPGHGQELVTVPPHVKGGQEVAINVPVTKTVHHKPTLKQREAVDFHKVFQHSSFAARRAAAKRRAAGELPRVGALPHIKTSHPFAAKMVDDSIASHYNSVNRKVRAHLRHTYTHTSITLRYAHFTHTLYV